MRAGEFIKQLGDEEIVNAVKSAEAKTSGEIRVFISHKPVDEALPAAQEIFDRLGMTKTRQRNAVLIFVAPPSRKFAVVGDAGIRARLRKRYRCLLIDEFQDTDPWQFDLAMGFATDP